MNPECWPRATCGIHVHNAGHTQLMGGQARQLLPATCIFPRELRLPLPDTSPPKLVPATLPFQMGPQRAEL